MIVSLRSKPYFIILLQYVDGNISLIWIPNEMFKRVHYREFFTFFTNRSSYYLHSDQRDISLYSWTNSSSLLYKKKNLQFSFALTCYFRNWFNLLFPSHQYPTRVGWDLGSGQVGSQKDDRFRISHKINRALDEITIFLFRILKEFI